MKNWRPLLGGMLSLIACAAGNQRYTNNEKWIIPDAQPYYRLKDKPRVITEVGYPEGADTPYDKKKIFYFRYAFNGEGDMVLRNSYMNDTLFVVSQSSYDENGYQYRTWAVGGKDTAWGMSRRFGGGRFKTITRHAHGSLNSTITSFFHDGQDCLQEIFRDTLAEGRPYQTIHNFYEGQRLVKSLTTADEGAAMARLYYSTGTSPDRIETSTGGNIVKRDIFINNKAGDPVQYWQIEGKDTVTRSSFSYTYDAHGNWIKRRDFTDNKTVMPNYFAPAGGSTYIMEREIVYHP